MPEPTGPQTPSVSDKPNHSPLLDMGSYALPDTLYLAKLDYRSKYADLWCPKAGGDRISPETPSILRIICTSNGGDAESLGTVPWAPRTEKTPAILYRTCDMTPTHT